MLALQNKQSQSDVESETVQAGTYSDDRSSSQSMLALPMRMSWNESDAMDTGLCSRAEGTHVRARPARPSEQAGSSGSLCVSHNNL
jgi:hypothetical protein